MLHITIPESEEQYDAANNEFFKVKEQSLQLEHSLVSISKWESKWHKPFLGKGSKTDIEMIDYIRCMSLTQNVDPNVFAFIDAATVQQIVDYIYDPHTATWFTDITGELGGSSDEIITSELIYYWMITLNIPVEFQKWHLNRLTTLIRVCNAKNSPPKKMSKRDIMARNKAINEARRRAANTKG